MEPNEATARIDRVAATMIFAPAILVAVYALAAEEWLTIVALTALAIAAGLYSRARRPYRESLGERGRLLGEQAVAEERLRIARELHDAVGHKVSLMVISAQTLEAGAPSSQAGASIADLGREAMAEMRATVSLMRPPDEGAEREPGPSLAEIARLLEQTRQAGIETELRVEGQERRYPATLELSAYRIVQEALTNVVRHADARSAVVSLRHLGSGLEVEVIDDGHGVRGEPAFGHGLIGMRERASLFGGELEFDTANGSGFRVAARLPAETAP